MTNETPLTDPNIRPNDKDLSQKPLVTQEQQAKAILKKDGFLCVDLPGNTFFDFIACSVGASSVNVIAVACSDKPDIALINTQAEQCVKLLRKDFGELKAFYFTDPQADEHIYLEMNKYDIVAVGPKNLSGLASSVVKQSRHYVDFDVPMLADTPALKPQLDFDEIAKRLFNNIYARNDKSKRESNGAALSVGIVGAWGSGKSTMLEMLRSLARKKDSVIISLNPWRLRGRRHFEEILLDSLVTILRGQISLPSYIWLRIKTLGILANWQIFTTIIVILILLFISLEMFINTGLASALFTGVTVTLSGAALITIVLKIIDYLREFFNKRNELDTRRADKMSGRAKRLIDLLKEEGKDVFVFIDDIDRCSPDRILVVLKTIHIVVDLGAYVYLAFDENYVSTAIEEAYGQRTQNFGRLFLGKLVSVPFYIPFVRADQIGEILLNTYSHEPFVPQHSCCSRSNLIAMTGSIGDLSGTRESSDEETSELFSQTITQVVGPCIVPLGLKPRDIRRISNVVLMYCAIYDFITDVEIKRLAAFYISLNHDRDLLVSISKRNANSDGPLGSHSEIRQLFEDLLSPERCNLERFFRLFGEST